MKVVFLRSNPVMPDPRVEKEANSLLADGYQIKILAWNREYGEQDVEIGHITLSNGSVPITRFNLQASYGDGMKTLGSLVSFQKWLLSWLWRHRNEYDVIHACDFDTVIPAKICSSLLKKKLVYDIFDYYVDAFRVPKRLKNFVERIDLSIINSADAVIITSEGRRKQIEKAHPKKLCVIHNSPERSVITKEEIKCEDRGRADRVKLVYVGILGESRFLMEALKIVAESDDMELHIGGFGSHESIIKDYAVRYTNIHFYGRLPYNRALLLEAQCDILFAVYSPEVPNHRYSSPNKLYEAMMLGKPIIVARGSGVDELVQKFQIGKCIDYEEDAFVIAVRELSGDKEFCRKISHKSREIYDQHFSWELMSRRLLELYGSLVVRLPIQ